MGELAASGEEVLADLRHDLRTPLNQIIGYAELVAESLGDDQPMATRQDLEKISRAARGLAELITREIQPKKLAPNPTREEAVVRKTQKIEGGPLFLREPKLVPFSPSARILIVDDQPDNCAVLQRRLEKEGHTCAAVHDGFSALARLGVEVFDLVLLDVMMPEMDGREVLRQIKADERLRHLPVIMISALDQIGSVVSCIELGAEDYLPKPFDPVLLRARIGASLDRKRLGDAERVAFAALEESQGKLAAELAEAAAYVQSVLPAPLMAGPVTASWQFRPSSTLGRDAFGYGSLGDDLFGICLLDVCGHGVGAALLSISVLNLIRAESLPGVDFADPGAVLAGLNTSFPMDRHGDMFFTAWCGIYDPMTRMMRFAAGGHPPAIMVKLDGSTELLAGKGPVIGAVPGMHFSAKETRIPPGARLFVFSDGAYEIQRGDGTMMSFGDLQNLLERAPRQGASLWVMDQLRAINPQPVFDDDVSLVELSFT